MNILEKIVMCVTMTQRKKHVFISVFQKGGFKEVEKVTPE